MFLLLCYYRPKNSDYTLKSVEMEELSVLSQRVKDNLNEKHNIYW